jgi:hypothetical protein
MAFTGTGAVLRALHLNHDSAPFNRERIYDRRPLKFTLVCPHKDRVVVVVVLIELVERRAFQQVIKEAIDIAIHYLENYPENLNATLARRGVLDQIAVACAVQAQYDIDLYIVYHTVYSIIVLEQRKVRGLQLSVFKSSLPSWVTTH